MISYTRIQDTLRNLMGLFPGSTAYEIANMDDPQSVITQTPYQYFNRQIYVGLGLASSQPSSTTGSFMEPTTSTWTSPLISVINPGQYVFQLDPTYPSSIDALYYGTGTKTEGNYTQLRGEGSETPQYTYDATTGIITLTDSTVIAELTTNHKLYYEISGYNEYARVKVVDRTQKSGNGTTYYKKDPDASTVTKTTGTVATPSQSSYTSDWNIVMGLFINTDRCPRHTVGNRAGQKYTTADLSIAGATYSPALQYDTYQNFSITYTPLIEEATYHNYYYLGPIASSSPFTSSSFQNNVLYNINPIEFPVSTSNWGAIGYVGLFDSETGGDPFLWAPISYINSSGEEQHTVTIDGSTNSLIPLFTESSFKISINPNLYGKVVIITKGKELPQSSAVDRKATYLYYNSGLAKWTEMIYDSNAWIKVGELSDVSEYQEQN